MPPVSASIQWNVAHALPEPGEPLFEEWDALAQKQSLPTVFTTPDWAAAWWRHFGRRRGTPYLITGHRDGELVALAPLAFSRKLSPTLVPARILELLGTQGLPMRGMGLADRADFLWLPDAPETLDGLVGELLRRRREYDLLLCRALPATSPTLAALERYAHDGGCLVRRTHRSYSPFTQLAGGWEAFLASRSKQLRKNWRKGMKRLEQAGGRFETFPGNDWSDAEALEAIVGVNRRSYKWPRGSSLFHDENLREFYADLFARLRERGRLRIELLWVGDQLAAYEVGFDFARTLAAYNAAYDLDHAALSPGTMVMAHIIEQASLRDASEYDMMRGDEDYKERWSTDRREELHVAVHHRSARSRAAYAAHARLKEIAKESSLARRAYDALSKLRRNVQR